MRRALLVAAYPAFIALVLAVTALANGALDPVDAGHPVVIRNEATSAATVRLLGTNDEAAFYEVPPTAEATVTPSSATGSVHELAILDRGCEATGVIGFGGGGPASHWSNVAMVVIGSDGSLGLLAPNDLAAWNETREPLPAAEARPVAGCEEQ